MSTSRRLFCQLHRTLDQSIDDPWVNANSRVTRRGDKVEQRVDTVIPETGITLDPGLFGKDIVVLPFEVRPDFPKATLSALHLL